MDYFVTVFFLGLIPAVIASSRGRNFFVWWFYGFWLLPIAFIHSLVVVFLPATASSEGMKQCPFCAEPVKEEAIVCRYCRKDIPTLVPFMPVVLPPEQEWPEPAATEPVIEARPVLRNVSANTSRCDGCGAYIPKARADQHRCAALAKAK